MDQLAAGGEHVGFSKLINGGSPRDHRFVNSKMVFHDLDDFWGPHPMTCWGSHQFMIVGGDLL